MSNFSVSNTPASTTGASRYGSDSSNVKQAQLDKDSFLQLLATQLKYQDPMNPVSNQDFLAQTAQFTSLEQITNLANATKDQLFGTQMTQGVQMIGKAVTYQPPAETLGGELPALESGNVQAVVVKGGEVMLKIGDKEIPVSQVTEVK